MPATPPAIVERLHSELKSILAEPEAQQYIRNAGLIPVDSPPPGELVRYVQSEIARWRGVVQQAGVSGIE